MNCENGFVTRFLRAKGFGRSIPLIKRLLKEMKLNMAYYQGREMAKHNIITERTGVKVFFADSRSTVQPPQTPPPTGEKKEKEENGFVGRVRNMLYINLIWYILWCGM